MTVLRIRFLFVLCYWSFTVCVGFQQMPPLTSVPQHLSNELHPHLQNRRDPFKHSLKRRRDPTPVRIFYQDDDSMEALERRKEFERNVNAVLKASRQSFQNVEGITNQLLSKQPLLALAIFVGAGLLVAYMMGLCILDGYMETWNPVENDSIPYWDEEILIIQRKVGR